MNDGTLIIPKFHFHSVYIYIYFFSDDFLLSSHSQKADPSDQRITFSSSHSSKFITSIIQQETFLHILHAQYYQKALRRV